MVLQQIRYLLPLFKEFVWFLPSKVMLVLLLMCLSSFTSGIGILFIVPLLESIGVSLGGGTNNIATKINDIASQWGISLSLEWVLIAYFLLILTIASLSYANSILSAQLQKSFAINLRLKIYSKLLNAQWQYLSSERMANFARLVTSQVQSVSMSIHQILTLCATLILVIVYLILSISLSPALTLLALFSAAILAFALMPLNKRIHQSGARGLRANQQIFQYVIEHLSSLKLIKSFAAEKQHFNKMEKSSEEQQHQELRITHFNALSRLVNLAGAALIFSILFYIAIKQLGLPLSNLLLILFIFSRLMPQVSSIQTNVQRLIHLAPEYDDLVKNVANLDEYAEISYQTDGVVPPLNYSIKLKDISYRYPDTDHEVISNLSLEFKKDQTIALTGPSGVGKSTLADIIAGLIPPTSGEIYADGLVIDESSRVLWRKNVAYVTQEVFLFHDTIRSNLEWVLDKEVEEETLWEVLDLAAAAQFVKALPMGLDTIIGDRGVKLSGGERQRLALARALLSDPQVLILDEATSALDKDNELKIREALRNLQGRLMVIIIAHNETTIEHADQRVNLYNIRNPE